MAYAFSATPSAGAGTVTLTAGSTTVTGVGTSFTAGSVNTILIVGKFNALITGYTSATQITIGDAPMQDRSGASYSTVAGATYIDVTGTETSLAGVTALAGISSFTAGIQTIYRFGAFRLRVASTHTLSYNGVSEAIHFASSIFSGEMNIGGTLTITGSRTTGTLTRNIYPTAIYFQRLGSGYDPNLSYIVGSGTKTLTGIKIDSNGTLSEVSYAITDCQIVNRDIASANLRMTTTMNANGLLLDRSNPTLIGVPARLDGLVMYSPVTPTFVSLTTPSPSSPYTFTDWAIYGQDGRFASYGTLIYTEFVNYGDYAGFLIGNNHNNGSYARFTKNLSYSYKTTDGSNVTSFISYIPDNNNGNRSSPYTADESMLLTGSSGSASGKRLLAIAKQTVNGGGNATPSNPTWDYRNPSNNNTGTDVSYTFAYDYLTIRSNHTLKGNGSLSVNLTSTADPNITLTEANARAKLASSFTIDTVNKKIYITQSSTIDDIYDAVKAYKVTANETNLKTPTIEELIFSRQSSKLVAYTGWELIINSGVTLSAGEKFDKVKADTLTVVSGGFITCPYTTSAGDFNIIKVTNLVSGSRVQLKNTDDNVELFNGIVNATSFYIHTLYTADKTIRYRSIYTSGLTAKEEDESFAIFGETGCSFIADQQDSTVYIVNGVDGSTVTEFSADYPNIQVDVTDPDGVTTLKRMYAWYHYEMMTAEGIEKFFNGITPSDESNYLINADIVSLQFDNKNSTPVRIKDGYIRRSDDGSVIASTSGSIQLDPGKAFIASSAQLYADVSTIKADTTTLKADTTTLKADTSDIITDIAGLNDVSTAEVLAQVTSGLTSYGTAKTTDLVNLDVAVSTRLASASYTVPPTASANASAVRTELTTELGRIDATVSSRLATSGYTAPDNASITSIKGTVEASKAHTDTLENADLSALATSAEINALNDISTAEVRTQVDNALLSYDPPTKSELDTAVSPLAIKADTDILKVTTKNTFSLLASK